MSNKMLSAQHLTFIKYLSTFVFFLNKEWPYDSAFYFHFTCQQYSEACRKPRNFHFNVGKTERTVLPLCIHSQHQTSFFRDTV